MKLDSFEAKETNEWVLDKAGIKRELLDTVKATKLAYYGHTMRNKGMPAERYNERNNATGTPARKATHCLDGQHEDVDRIPRERVSQNDRGQG